MRAERTKQLPVMKRGKIVHTTVDEIDWIWAMEFHWSMNGNYVTRSQRRGAENKIYRMFLHREIVGLKHSPLSRGIVDHINGDPLDNRRSNLRIVTMVENAHNRRDRTGVTSRYRGVSWYLDKRKPKPYGRWRVQVMVEGKRKFLGLFTDEDEAGRVAAAYYAEHMPYRRQG